ncbi:hypothetical protein QFZ54_002051 [Sphingomonas faeni]|nr:hypothetical protein [Sphingomonas faeni]
MSEPSRPSIATSVAPTSACARLVATSGQASFSVAANSVRQGRGGVDVMGWL